MNVEEEDKLECIELSNCNFQNLDDLPKDINVISQYVRDEEKPKERTLDHQIKKLNIGSITNDPEFQALSLVEQHREIVSQDDINKLSYNFHKDVQIDDKHYQQQQLQFINHFSRNVMCQHDDYRKQQGIVRKKLIVDQDVMINQKDVTLEDISNIVGDRISENELVKMIDPYYLDENLKKA